MSTFHVREELDPRLGSLICRFAWGAILIVNQRDRMLFGLFGVGRAGEVPQHVEDAVRGRVLIDGLKSLGHEALFR